MSYNIKNDFIYSATNKMNKIRESAIYSITINPPNFKREQSTWRSIKTTKPIGEVTFHPGDMYVLLPKCLMYASYYFMTTPSSVCTAMQRKICVFTKSFWRNGAVCCVTLRKLLVNRGRRD